MNLRDPNQELELAVQKNDVISAKIALNNGADLNYIISSGSYYQSPIIFHVKSIEMLDFFLKNGVDPNIEEISTYAFFNSPITYICSLMEKYVLRCEPHLLMKLVNFRPHIIDNKTINKVLMFYLKETKNADLENDFFYKSQKGKIIISLIQVSTDLQENVLLQPRESENPFCYALKENKQGLVKLMLNNNSLLWEDLKFKNNTEILKYIRTDELNQLLDESSLNNFFDSIQIIMLILLSGFYDKDSIFSALPKEIILLIINTAAFSHDYSSIKMECIRQNLQLADKMQSFIKYFSILQNAHHDFSWNDFMRNNDHINNPCNFFTRVQHHVLRDKKGLVAITEDLSECFRHPSPANEKLVSTLFAHCSKGKTLSIEAKEGLTTMIRQRLS